MRTTVDAEVEMEMTFMDPGDLKKIMDQQVVEQYLRDLKGHHKEELMFGPRLCGEVTRLVSRLSARDRRLLQYKFALDMSDDDISHYLEISPLAVRGAIYRIVRSLRSSLGVVVEQKLERK